MTGLLDELVQPFERVAPAAVAEVLRDAWDLEALSLTLLDTERDDTFRVDTSEGPLLAKVAHPADDAALLDLQDAALAAIATADPGLPAPRVLTPHRPAAVDGRAVRVMTWLPGTQVEAASLPLAETATLLARLSLALAPLDAPAADRMLAWDLTRVPDLAAYTGEPRLLDALARFGAEISPVLAALPRQVIHNDLHPGNLLVADGRITGILDFGDIVRAPRVCDLGVALGYLIPEHASGSAVRAGFTTAFETVAPLSDAERAVIPGLVAGRELQRVIINDHLGRSDGHLHAAPRTRRQLDRALEDWT